MDIRVLDVQLETEEVRISASDHKAFRRYLDQGFSVYERENGFYLLKKGSKILVTIEYKEKRSIIDVKKTLSRYYKKNDNTRLYKCFNWDLKKDKVKLTLDSNGYYILVEK